MILRLVILGTIIYLTFLILQKRTSKSKEIIVPPHRSATNQDTEFAEEFHTNTINQDSNTEKEINPMKVTDDEQTIISKNNYSQESAEELVSTQLSDHIVQIGFPTEKISGHEIKINIELTHTFTALSKDPYWVHLYWVLPPDAPRGIWEIKIHNLSQQIEFFKQIDPMAGSWYLHLNQPNQNFVFTLGVRDEFGNFSPVLVSNEIQTPPNRPSNKVDAEWGTIEELYGEKMLIHSEGSPEFIMQICEKEIPKRNN